jgi:Na+-translocating ferredoxin:NAD+ oxidoreductase RnfG subunit
MVRNVLIAVVALLSLVWVAAGYAEVKEGLWEITTKSEIKGMPAQMPVSTTKQCITKNNIIPKPEKQEKGQECKVKDQKMSGDSVTYAIECKDASGTIVQVSGKTTYKGNVFDGTTNTTIKSKDQGTMEMTSKMSGKYAGPCPK